MTPELMIAIGMVFVGVAALTGLIGFVVIERMAPERSRLERFSRKAEAAGAAAVSLVDDSSVAPWLKAVLPKSPKEMGRIRHQLARAGYHGTTAATVYVVAELACPIVFGLAGYWFFGGGPGLFFAAVAAFVGYMVPVFGSSEGLVGSSEPGVEAIVFASDGCIVEAVDEHDRPVPRGTPSTSILITNLFNHVQPLIRYRIEDRFVIEDGDGHLRATVEGRRADVLRFGDVEIHPLTITSELTHEPAIVDHRVVQTDRGVDIDVETTAPIDPRAVAATIERALARAGVDDPRASVHVVERLPIDPATGKIARFVPRHQRGPTARSTGTTSEARRSRLRWFSGGGW